MDEYSIGNGTPAVPGARRYLPPAFRAMPARGWFEPPRASRQDRFREAILALSREDEEVETPEDRGPITFRDGIFQIDATGAAGMPESGGTPGIDPDLKGLIDSILNP